MLLIHGETLEAVCSNAVMINIYFWVDPGNGIAIFAQIQHPVPSSETSLFGNCLNIIAQHCSVPHRYLLSCPVSPFPV